MFNNDDPAVRDQAWASLLLDLTKRKVPISTAEPSFLGFRKKPSGKLDTCAPGFGVRSDWPDLNDLCNSSQIHLSWRNAQNHTVVVSDALITDNNISVQAVLNIDDNTTQVLNPQCCRCDIIECHQTCQWLRSICRGNLPACRAQTTPCPTQHYKSILKFTIKARLQVLPTKYNLALWYPAQHDPGV